MQAFKLKGKVDEAGNLTIAESVALMPGEVEVIILKPAAHTDELSGRTNKVSEDAASKDGSQVEAIESTFKTKVKALANWFESVPPAPQDFDTDEARWQSLKEKYDL